MWDLFLWYVQYLPGSVLSNRVIISHLDNQASKSKITVKNVMQFDQFTPYQQGIFYLSWFEFTHLREHWIVLFSVFFLSQITHLSCRQEFPHKTL